MSKFFQASISKLHFWNTSSSRELSSKLNLVLSAWTGNLTTGLPEKERDLFSAMTFKMWKAVHEGQHKKKETKRGKGGGRKLAVVFKVISVQPNKSDSKYK